MTRSGDEGTGRYVDARLCTEPFHVALRTAIRHRGLTLERLRFHLARRGVRVGLSSLSNWQNGHSRPEAAGSLRAVRALEDVLDLPPRSLVRLLARSGRPVQAHRAPIHDLTPVAELLDDFTGPRSAGHERGGEGRAAPLGPLPHRLTVALVPAGRATEVVTPELGPLVGLLGEHFEI